MSKNTQQSQGSSSARVRDQRDGTEASMLLLEVSVESLTLTTQDEDRCAYMEAVLGFYDAVKSDFDGVLTDLRKLLTADYGAKALRSIPVSGMEGSLTFEVQLPRTKLVSIQCEHSSGRLRKQIQKVLVTEKLLGAFSASDITLTCEPKSM